MRNSSQNQRGFTLVELMVVISIIGFLASVVQVNLQSSKDSARGAQIVRNIRELQTALEFYNTQYGVYPAQIGSDDFPNGVDAFDMNPIPPGKAGFEETLLGLVEGGYLPVVPHFPSWPNNESYSDGFFEYQTESMVPDIAWGGGSYYCGDSSWEGKGYVLLVGSPMTLNLPPFQQISADGVLLDWSQQADQNSGHVYNYYCVTSQ